MTPMIITGYSLIVVLALNDTVVSGESYLQQAPSATGNPAFVEQLPETPVTPAPQPPVNRRVQSHKPRQAPRPQPQTLLANSIFPNVGGGVTERAAPGPADSRLPTVGPGTVGR